MNHPEGLLKQGGRCAHYGLWLSLMTMVWTALGADLRQEALFLAGQGGYHTFRIPSLIVTRKGTVLAFCEGRKTSGSDTGDIDLVLRRSLDGGKTWAAQQVVWDDGDNTCGNPCPVVDQKTGAVLLLTTHNPGKVGEKEIMAKKTTSARTVWLLRSEDEGQSWSAPAEITASVKDPSWGWYATGPGIGIQIQFGPHAGRLVIPCDHSYEEQSGKEGGTGPERGAHIIYSDDHGRSWNCGGTVRPKMNECQVVELAGGKGELLLSLRNYQGRNRRAHSTSSDGGLTWTEAEIDEQLPDPTCQASILRYDWPEGKQPGRVLFCNPASTRRENLTIRVSRDDGNSWPISRTLSEGPAAYSCLAVLPDGSIGCLYECGQNKAYEKIMFAQFSVSWADGKAR